MTDLQHRLEDIILRHVGLSWFEHAPALARSIIAELALEEETQNLPVFVEDVPRRLIDDFVFADGEEHYAKHIEFIPHSHCISPWYGADCADCQDEFGVHDRRHAEIVAESLSVRLERKCDD